MQKSPDDWDKYEVFIFSLLYFDFFVDHQFYKSPRKANKIKTITGPAMRIKPMEINCKITSKSTPLKKFVIKSIFTPK
jgi:hypothetical protein